MFVLRRAPRSLSSTAHTLWRGNAGVAAIPATSEPVPPPPPPPAKAPKVVEPAAAKAEKSTLKPAKAPKAAEPAAAKAEESTPEPAKSETLATDDASAEAGKAERKKNPHRPDISLEKPRKWNRPVDVGIIPAYDLALQYLKEDSEKLHREANVLRKEIHEKERQYHMILKKSADPAEVERAEALDAELEELRETLHAVEVQSEVNLPDVRWSVANAMANMSKASHRHLLEQRWRKEGDLDLLMERIYQMHVVPDLLPAIHPSIDLRVVAPATPAIFHKTGKVDAQVEPGSFITPKQTVKPPKLYANVFHTDTRLYTMLLVDPDMPHEETASYQTFLHWMKPNIPLSAASTNSRITDLNTHTQYIPPHPQNGTPYHRYTLLLLPQPPRGASKYTRNVSARAGTNISSQHLDIPVVPDDQRVGFDVRAFCAQWGLDASKGGGVHMWREVWSEDVSKIYSEILKLPEPRFARPPKADPYADVKQAKRYVV